MIALSSIEPAEAQQAEPQPFVIEFGAQLDFILEDFEGIDAVVGQTVCASLDYPTEHRQLILGGAGAPTACNQEWRAVTLVPKSNHPPLGNDIILKPGTTVIVSTIRPFPGVDGPFSAPFLIEIRADGVEITTEELIALDSVTAYIAGVECGRGEAHAEENGFTVPIGAPGTPAVCSSPGAEIVLIEESGTQLAVRPSLVGPFYTLSDLTPDPQARGIPRPAAAGNAGVAFDGSTRNSELLLVALALGLVAGARRFTRRRAR